MTFTEPSGSVHVARDLACKIELLQTFRAELEQWSRRGSERHGEGNSEVPADLKRIRADDVMPD